jgi:hypothetical protein
VKPEVPPHEPSVETLPAALVGEGVAALVDVAGLVEVAGLGVLTGLLEPQFPKPDWQPVPQ